MPACINDDGAPVWASYWLCAAGIYNLVWGRAHDGISTLVV
ncbi:hypothetical protein [Bythopirellula polymerisocia]|nr:hypothetical protein [Bythopirellula polymerisocia]